MVGYQHGYAESIGLRDAVHAGYTIVDRNQERRFSLAATRTILWTSRSHSRIVWHQVLDVSEAEFAKTAYDQCCAGSPVNVIVTDDVTRFSRFE